MPQLTKTKSHRKSRSCSKTTASVNTVKITKCACCSIFTFEKCLIASHNHMFVIIKHWLLSSRDCEFARAWNFWSINSVSVCLFGMNYQLYFPLFTFMNEIDVKFFSQIAVRGQVTPRLNVLFTIWVLVSKNIFFDHLLVVAHSQILG